MENCYTNLANAVILLAVKDYRRALRRQKKVPEDKAVKTRKLECERFFAPAGLRYSPPWTAKCCWINSTRRCTANDGKGVSRSGISA